MIYATKAQGHRQSRERLQYRSQDSSHEQSVALVVQLESSTLEQSYFKVKHERSRCKVPLLVLVSLGQDESVRDVSQVAISST